MYLYDDFDRTLLAERVAEFRGQVARRLTGELNEDEFKSLRLMNGVYLQLHAYMLRIAIPYGTLASDQMRKLAHVARRYDRGYGHFTTRQNIQFNWIKLAELPNAMADLADSRLHGMQTSGNCVRNITTDQWAAVAPDEIAGLVALRLQRLQLVGVDLADVAEHLRGERRVVQHRRLRVLAHGQQLDVYPRVIVGALEDREPLLERHVEIEDRRH